MGPYLSTPNKEKDSEGGSSQAFAFGACSMQGWRKSQEDSHIAELQLGNECQVFGVFDGHGGGEVSAYVKEFYVSELRKNKNFQERNYEVALTETFKRIDDVMLQPEGAKELAKIRERTKSEGQDYDDDMHGFGGAAGGSIAQFTGCTAVVVLVTPTHFICANAGDSRSVLARTSPNAVNLQTVALSEDHKPDNYDEKRRIEAAGGFVEDNRVNGSLNLSRSLGDFTYKQKADKPYDQQMVICVPEIYKVERQPGKDKFLILACDGIWDCLSSEQCVENVRKRLAKKSQQAPLYGCIEDLFDELCATDILQSAGVGTDNMTAIIVDIL